MADETMNQEQAHLNWVEQKLAEKHTELSRQLKHTKADAKRVEADFKNNVRIKTDTYSGMMETALSVRQQQQLLTERLANQNQTEKQLGTIERLQQKPYFARIDFQEKGSNRKETAYIGLASFHDQPDRYLVYDWRAPISSIYYDGGLGEVSYQTPDGTQQANLTLKRQFIIEDGKITTLYDTDETVGDAMLLSALDNKASTKMKSIVSTIQQQQNVIIRDTKSDLLFVQGAAGSGKTAAVLQRVAYLLYRYRGNLSSSQIILFSPNQLFNDYINSVLPELGEHNMVQLTFYQYAQHRVPNFKVQTLASRFEAENDENNKKINRYTGSVAYFKATAAYADYLGHHAMPFAAIKHAQEVLFSPEEIAKIYYSFNDNYTLGNRLFATKEALIKRLNQLINRKVKDEAVQKQIQELSKDHLARLYGSAPRNFADGTAELEFLARQLLLEQYESVQSAINHNLFINFPQLLVNFWRDVAVLLPPQRFGVTKEQWQFARRQKLSALKQKQLTTGDVTTYLYLFDLVTGRHPLSDIRQVFVDEVQDYSPYQLAYLKHSFPKAKFTLLGDLNQAIFTGSNAQPLLAQVKRLFDADRTRVVQLSKSYRSTKEITLFSRSFLQNGAAIEPFARSGNLPQVAHCHNEGAALSAVIDELNAAKKRKMTPTIITKTLQAANELAKRLAENGIKSTVIATENQRLAAGLVIIPAYLAKGLEFDSVIVWQATKENYPISERQLLYTVCSRAMHRLLLVSSCEMTPLLASVNSELFQQL